MRILKWAFETVEQARTDTQPTNHGMSHARIRDLTQDVTGIPCERRFWDIRITGERPDGRNSGRP